MVQLAALFFIHVSLAMRDGIELNNLNSGFLTVPLMVLLVILMNKYLEEKPKIIKKIIIILKHISLNYVLKFQLCNFKVVS